MNFDIQVKIILEQANNKQIGWFGVVDSNGAVKAHPWKSADDWNKIDHLRIFGFGAGIRWRARYFVSWYQTPNEEEMMAVDNFLYKKGIKGLKHQIINSNQDIERK